MRRCAMQPIAMRTASAHTRDRPVQRILNHALAAPAHPLTHAARPGPGPSSSAPSYRCICTRSCRLANQPAAAAINAPSMPAAVAASSSSSGGPSTLLLIDAMGLAFRQYFGCEWPAQGSGNATASDRQTAARWLMMRTSFAVASSRCDALLCICPTDKNRHAPLVADIADPEAGGAPALGGGASSTSTSTSRDVGALYGYASSLLNLCYLLKPTHVAACMDLGNRSSFRHHIFPGPLRCVAVDSNDRSLFICAAVGVHHSAMSGSLMSRNNKS